MWKLANPHESLWVRSMPITELEFNNSEGFILKYGLDLDKIDKVSKRKIASYKKKLGFFRYEYDVRN